METLAGVIAVWTILAIAALVVGRMARLKFADAMWVVMLGVCALQLATLVGYGVWAAAWAVAKAVAS